MIPLGPYVPEDLDDFWSNLVAEAFAEPLDAHRSLRNEYDLTGFTVETLEFRGMGGRKLHGWMAYPEGARRLPGFLWIPPYGRWSMLPDPYGTRPGFVSLSFNFHGEGAFHEEAYTPKRGYFAEGAASPETWIFRRMAQDAVIALRLMQAQVEVDEDRMAAMGMSQGGGMAIWLGACCRLVRCVVAEMPFLADAPAALSAPFVHYPLKELADFMGRIPVGRETVLNTISYFDTVNLAARCAVPTRVGLGLRDPASRPDGVRAAYRALPGEKELVEYAGGHDWDPAMISGGRSWMLNHLKG